MLKFNNWTIEQTDWLPNEEKEIEQQLTFSNGYLCQTAHFEEHYSGEQRLCTYIKGIETSIINLSSISVRLHDERLDLHEWRVDRFYRCLHKNEPLLERQVTAISPKGHILELDVQRRLMEDNKGVMQLSYKVRSVNYTGPITMLAILRGGEDADKWYSLLNHVGDNICWTWAQMEPMNLQICCAMNYQMYKNNLLVSKRPIKVEKQKVIGYSLTQSILPGETLLLKKNVAVLDSLHNDKDSLIENTVQCLTNW